MNESIKYALVTGASSGIGWHISKELAQRAYSLVAVSNQPKELQELKTELEREYAIIVEILNVDLSQKESAQQVYNFCRENEIEIEVLVNNAGMMVSGKFIQTDLLSADKILQLHMNTPVMLCRLFGEDMKNKEQGFILNISSISAVMPYPVIALYGPTKTFVRKFSKALRSEMKVLGIHVTCLIPGATETALFDTSKINLKLAHNLGIMRKPQFVAKAGVNALFNGKAEKIPGIFNKLIMIFVLLVPRFVIDLIYRKVSKNLPS